MIGNCNAAGRVLRVVFHHLASRWGPLVMQQVVARERRYPALRAAVGIGPKKVLVQTLRKLERDGHISRTSYPVFPPNVVYALKLLGRECVAHVAAMLGWIETRRRDLAEAQRSYDATLQHR